MAIAPGATLSPKGLSPINIPFPALGDRGVEVTPRSPKAPTPWFWPPPAQCASPDYYRQDLLSSPQPEPFKQVPERRIAAALVGALPPARAPHPPFLFPSNSNGEDGSG